MILFTTGHERFQFDSRMRMVSTVREAFPDDAIFVQYGHSTYIPQGLGIQAVQLLSSQDFREAVERARVVISHCGEGNLLLLQEVRKPFVLVPRTRRRKEHVDDHQFVESITRVQDLSASARMLRAARAIDT
jgi:UDP-N-acetylglucosamine transferase subunit ALG13